MTAIDRFLVISSLLLVAAMSVGCAVADRVSPERDTLPLVTSPIARSTIVIVETADESVPSEGNSGTFSKQNYRYLVKTAECAVRNSGLFHALHPYEGENLDVTQVRLRFRLRSTLEESVGFYAQTFSSFLTLGIVPWSRRTEHRLEVVALDSAERALARAHSEGTYKKTAGWLMFPILLFEDTPEQVLGDTFYYMTLDALARLTEAGAWDRLAPAGDSTPERILPSVREAPSSPR